MTRHDRRIYQFGIASAAAFIIAAVLVLTASKNVVFADDAVSDEYFIDETAKVPEKGQIRANSAMPCDDPDGFRNWYEDHRRNYEPETEEEARPDDGGADHEEAGTDSEQEPVAEETEAQVESAVPPLYRIGGETIDEGLQERLYQHLSAAGIGYWYEGALAQMYQESHCQQYAENPNGLDKGLYQYRATFWTAPESIFDVDAQLRRYASEMAARFNSGLSVDEAISRHKTSDFVTAVDWEYVGQVKQHLSTMERIR